MTERIIDTEQACHSQLCWRLKVSNNFLIEPMEATEAVLLSMDPSEG